MKVSYVTMRGFLSTAYLEDRDDWQVGDIATGEDKHNGALVTCRWDGNDWVQVA